MEPLWISKDLCITEEEKKVAKRKVGLCTHPGLEGLKVRRAKKDNGLEISA